MPKTLACCERHVAVDSSMRTKAVWEHISACSSVRIARGLEAAHENFKARVVSEMDDLLDNTGDDAHYVHKCMSEVRNVLNRFELNWSVPPCKAFLEMADAIPSQAEAAFQS